MKARLLVVDDEVEIREMLSRHFRFDDYEVHTATNGARAIEVMRREKIDVVISDIMMPEMDGITLLRLLRDEYPMVHTILITGYVHQGNLLAGIRHGAFNCIFKPLHDMTELEQSVSAAVLATNRWYRKLCELHEMKPEDELRPACAPDGN